jgi:lysophospholipase L1-like esterase
MSFLLYHRGPFPLRRLLARLTLLGSSLIFTLLILEFSLRLVFYHSKDFGMEMWKYAVQLKQPVSNPDLSFVHVPNGHAFLMGVEVEINSQGLRDHEYSFAKSSDVYRIMMLGDSTTFGWGVPLGSSAPKLLERRLNGSRFSGIDRFEVINGGIGNYNTVQELAYYETFGKAFNPDLVILMFFINDPEPVPTERHYSLARRSYLFAFVASRLDTLLRSIGIRPNWETYYASLYDDDKPGFRACKRALANLATFPPSRRVMVALLPELRQINNDSYPFKAQHLTIKNLLAAEGVPVIDLIDGLKDHGPEGGLWVTSADDHPNAKANTLIANQLQGWIVRELFLNARKTASDRLGPHRDIRNRRP